MPTAKPLDDRYLEWLYSQVATVKSRRSSKTHWGLLKQLYSTEFTWFVPHDENRAADGCALRMEWAHETRSFPDHDWLNLGCSFLEMLIGLARRLEFQTDDPSAFWFWHLIDNLGFLEYHDRSNYSENYVAKRTSVVCKRTYDQLGNGGLFPIRNPDQDQRKVELWYQLCEYILQDL